MIKCILAYCNYPGTPGTSYYCERALRKILGDSSVITLGHNNEIDTDDGVNPYPILEDKILSGELELSDDAILLEVESGGFDLGWHPSSAVHIPTIWWAIDTHIATEHHQNKAHFYSRVFLAQRAYLQTMRSSNMITDWMPLACDPDIHDGALVECDPAYANHDIVFVGHIHPVVHHRRCKLLRRLQDEGIDVGVYQEKWLKDVTTIYRSCPLVLNCSLSGDINMRFFEALASGSALIQDRFPPESGINFLLETTDHPVAMFYNNHEEAIDHIKSMRNNPSREVLGNAGRSWVLQHHTYEHRMRDLLTRLGVSYDG
jgi:hypothetical protein